MITQQLQRTSYGAGLMFILCSSGISFANPLTCEELQAKLLDLETERDAAREEHLAARAYRVCLGEIVTEINSAQLVFDALPEDERGENGPSVVYPACAAGLEKTSLEETKTMLMTASEVETVAWNTFFSKAQEFTERKTEFDAGCP